MRRLRVLAAIALAFIMALPATAVYANNQADQARQRRVGQIGFFGGITQGAPLPTTRENMAPATNGARGRGNNTLDLSYSEMVWLTGVPALFEGTIRVQTGGVAVGSPGVNSGAATITYQVRANDATDENVDIFRNATFRIDWRREGNQIIENYTLTNWVEEIYVNGETFSLIPAQSNFSISILRDITPGITYYSGDISMRAVFSAAGGAGEEGDDEGGLVTHEVAGQVFGFISAWSATETHRLQGIVSNPNWQMQYNLVPSVTVSMQLQYSNNEPTLISFSGNYREVMSNQSGLVYEITVLPNIFYGTPTTGRAHISTFNSFEQLHSPNLNFLRGHFAYADIRRLFAMEVLWGNPAHFVPGQGVNRGEFVKMLARAVRMPLDQSLMPAPARGRGRGAEINQVFPDVYPHRPDFLYIMTVHEMGIAIGRGYGHFHPDEVLSRQEAYVLALRMLGLSNLGHAPTPITPFVDDHAIGDWARQDIYAAARIGLIQADEDGMLHPNQYMHKAEAAALINRLIEYMRHELQRDYTENVINFIN